MRLAVTFSKVDRCKLSWNYPENLQALVYRWLAEADGQLARALHDRGYVFKGHRYKLFVYSLLHGEHSKGDREGIELSGQIKWQIASPCIEFMEALALGLLRLDEVRLEQNRLRLEAVSVPPTPQFSSGRAYLRTLSPIVVSTVLEQNGLLKKRFLAPEDSHFGRVLGENLCRKASLLSVAAEAKIEFEPVKLKSRLFCLHGTYVRGWEGWFFVEAAPELLQVGYEAGFGERNGQGFGMVEVVCRRSPGENPLPEVDGRNGSEGGVKTARIEATGGIVEGQKGVKIEPRWD